MITETVEFTIPDDIQTGWQEMADILAHICGIPSALIMKLSQEDIEVLVSSKTDNNPYHPGDRERFDGSGLYCETVIKTRSKLLVPDARMDAVFKNCPDIKLNMISYLGFPIVLPDQKPFGTICILDDKENHYSKMIESLILKFRNLIESHLELIYMNQILGDKNKRLTDYLMEIQALRGMVPICANCKNIRDAQNNWHSIEMYLAQNPEFSFSHTICPTCMNTLYPDFDEDS